MEALNVAFGIGIAFSLYCLWKGVIEPFLGSEKLEKWCKSK